MQEGGAVYNFTGPQGFGVANMADSLYAVRQLVYQERKFSMRELKEALEWNYGEGFDHITATNVASRTIQDMEKQGKL